MLKSMTAYGRGVVGHRLGRFEVEIQSLNRRYLEIQCQLPRELSRFEVEVRKQVSRYVKRGLVTVRVSASFEGGTPLTVRPNLPLARQLKAALDAVAREAGGSELDADTFVRLVAREDGLLTYGIGESDDDAYGEVLATAVGQAIEGLVQMKEAEGVALQRDIEQRMANLRDNAAAIASLMDGVIARYRDKLHARLEEVVAGAVENEERLLREVVVYADRIDIAEEVTRCASHLDQMAAALAVEKSNDGIGKRLEFLVQELNREYNTIGSKAGDKEVSKRVVDSKADLERIREQVQNVE